MSDDIEPGSFIRATRPDALNVALVSGPMYDSLYELIPEFENKTGRRVHVAAKLVHPELNAHLEEVYKSPMEHGDLPARISGLY